MAFTTPENHSEPARMRAPYARQVSPAYEFVMQLYRQCVLPGNTEDVPDHYCRTILNDTILDQMFDWSEVKRVARIAQSPIISAKLLAQQAMELSMKVDEEFHTWGVPTLIAAAALAIRRYNKSLIISTWEDKIEEQFARVDEPVAVVPQSATTVKDYWETLEVPEIEETDDLVVFDGQFPNEIAVVANAMDPDGEATPLHFIWASGEVQILNEHFPLIPQPALRSRLNEAKDPLRGEVLCEMHAKWHQVKTLLVGGPKTCCRCVGTKSNVKRGYAAFKVYEKFNFILRSILQQRAVCRAGLSRSMPHRIGFSGFTVHNGHKYQIRWKRVFIVPPWKMVEEDFEEPSEDDPDEVLFVSTLNLSETT